MQVQGFGVRQYRSVYDLDVKLKHVNIVTGPNGCGKSNLFNAFVLIREAILGRLSERLVEEGGLASVLWAGPRRKGPVRMELTLDAEPFQYELELGLRPVSEQPVFPLDPQVKKEKLKLGGRLMVDRASSMVTLRPLEGPAYKRYDLVDSLSVFAQAIDPERLGYLSLMKESVSRWALYHEFRTDAQSPLRLPAVGTYPRQFLPDGSNLSSALKLIEARGEVDLLHQMVKEALPQGELLIRGEDVRMMHEGLSRPTEARELSDGTLKFLCLACACLFVHHPPVMVFNEPETSLSPSAIPPLAKLIAHASQFSQIWITTHNMELARLVAEMTGGKTIALDKFDGETGIVGGSHKGVYVFEEE